jgi:hypothetical protein
LAQQPEEPEVGIERGQFRLERAQHNPMGLALRAYLRLEQHRWRARVSIFNSKLDIMRAAVRLADSNAPPVRVSTSSENVPQ